MMKKLCLVPAALLLAFPFTALAQQPNDAAEKKEAAPEAVADCPPGAFCEQTKVSPPDAEAPDAEAVAGDEVTAARGDDGTTVTLPPPPEGSDPDKARTFTYQPDPDGGPGQIIIYEDGDAPPAAGGLSEVEAPPPPPTPKERKRWRKHRRWGMNLRVAGVLMPRYRSDVDDASGMAGLGLSLRYRPTPMFALDLGTDFVGGIDANGYERQELPISVSAMLYANPRNVVQFYLFGGLNWSFARVFSERIEPHLADGNSDEYTYFGGHGGLGLEFRVSKLVGINVDGMAFVRTRTDSDDSGRFPEFYNPRTSEASNSSAAGMLRAGVTFWW